MKTNSYLFLKLIVLSIPFSVIFYILEYGFTFDSKDKFLGPILLAGFMMVMLFKPRLKRHILFLICTCFSLMILTYLFNLLNFSNTIGSFGFSLLLVTIALYFPQIIKKGHIERF